MEKLEALEKRTDLSRESMIEATELARAQIDQRLSAMNEFREALRDQSGTYFTRKEHELFMERVNIDLRELRESRAELAGKASQSTVNISFIVSVVGLLLSTAALIKVLI